jgi:quercetin dioxygenase-like cupin family protein
MRGVNRVKTSIRAMHEVFEERGEASMRGILVAATLAIGSFAVSQLRAQILEISPAEKRTSARGPATAYTGVGIAEFLFRANDASNLTAAEISFEPGARTAWHNHPAGQYLIVTAGIGWVQARGEAKRIVRAGDVVWTPPGVFHWHGATATQGMRHLAVWEFVDGSGGELGEHVSDEEYLR